MKSSAMTTNTSSDDNKIIIERPGTAPIAGQRGGNSRWNSATREANSAGIGDETERFTAETAKS